MRKTILIAVAAVLAGCGAVPVAPPPVVQVVEKAVPVPCLESAPAKPAFPIVPKIGNIYDKAKALVARDKIRDGYEAELEAAISSCVSSSRTAPKQADPV